MTRLLFVVLLMVSINCAARPTDPSNSIYQLNARLTDQRGQVHGLDVHRGHPVLITMFYSSCAASCPLIIDALRATERALSAQDRKRLRVLMISIDPANDTPARLLEVAKTRNIDGERWTLAQVDEATVRQIAAVLNVQYRRLPNGEYNHSNTITVLSPEGEIKAKSTSLRADPEVVRALSGMILPASVREPSAKRN